MVASPRFLRGGFCLGVAGLLIFWRLHTQAPAGQTTLGEATKAGLGQDRAGEDVAVEFRLFVQELKGLQADSGVESVHFCSFVETMDCGADQESPLDYYEAIGDTKELKIL